MRVSFYDILSSHSRAYPNMTAEDYYALAYESEFGRTCLGDDDADALLNELKAIKADSLEPFTVSIGGGYARLDLSPIKPYLSAGNILALMSLTSREGSDEGLERKVSLIHRAAVMGILPSAASDIGKCEGEPKHSAVYKRLYGASYRIIDESLSAIVPALCLISEALGKAENVTVLIDGREGSGKGFGAFVINEVFKSEAALGRLSVMAKFGAFECCSDSDIKLFFDTDEESRRLRIIERGGENAWDKYQSETRACEDGYIEKFAPQLNCDIVVRA